jgi:hypothetical protein
MVGLGMRIASAMFAAAGSMTPQGTASAQDRDGPSPLIKALAAWLPATPEASGWPASTPSHDGHR